MATLLSLTTQCAGVVFRACEESTAFNRDNQPVGDLVDVSFI